jgi:hypothetical protein
MKATFSAPLANHANPNSINRYTQEPRLRQLSSVDTSDYTIDTGIRTAPELGKGYDGTS